MEIEREVPTHESVSKVANDLKLEVAKLAAGSDSVELEKCLRVVNYPDKWDKVQKLRALCDAYKYEIAILKESLKKDYPRIIDLKTLVTNQEVIQEISDRHNVGDALWDDIKEAIASQESQLQEGIEDSMYSQEKAVFDQAVDDKVEPF
ncbi:hypothetical protein [Okeania sp. SIO2B3]|uniref:hypothetical protein n=1 Tax=Okeania sp. SIO2B3 TaxID=2607784 RepID=UPI0013BEEA56|nr:hypothetical protein [Okeania sp. SIO2B3]NET46739.1 hypothetical protein [Okeania sp. SIO2B3]